MSLRELKWDNKKLICGEIDTPVWPEKIYIKSHVSGKIMEFSRRDISVLNYEQDAFINKSGFFGPNKATQHYYAMNNDTVLLILVLYNAKLKYTSDTHIFDIETTPKGLLPAKPVIYEWSSDTGDWLDSAIDEKALMQKLHDAGLIVDKEKGN